MHLPDGTVLQGGKYRIERFINSGGFGCTYMAVHTVVNKRMAIKEFFVNEFCERDDSGTAMTVPTLNRQPLVARLLEKFVDEARALFAFDHPGIVKINDIFHENGTAYIVMNYIDGCTLQSLVDSQGPLPEYLALQYIRQVCDALAYVHAKNRLHLDIKPGNIMIDENGNAILIDFGVSKQYDETNGENNSTLMGRTPGYAPLEQIGNNFVNFSPAADIYALGATLYKLITGITPPEANLLANDESLPPIHPHQASPSTIGAIYAAMELRRINRPQSISEFLAILNGHNLHNTQHNTQPNTNNNYQQINNYNQQHAPYNNHQSNPTYVQQYPQPPYQPYNPEYATAKRGVGFFTAIKLGFKNYKNFSGKASRSEFWWWTLLWASLIFILTCNFELSFVNYLNIDDQFHNRIETEYEDIGQAFAEAKDYFLSSTVILFAVFAISIVPTISLTYRRFNDLGKKGWSSYVLPVIFFIMILNQVLKAADIYSDDADIWVSILLLSPPLFIIVAIIQSTILVQSPKPNIMPNYRR